MIVIQPVPCLKDNYAYLVIANGHNREPRLPEYPGTFNGQNYAISNLVINRPTTSPAGDNTGLFGYINNATVNAVGLIGGVVRPAE